MAQDYEEDGPENFSPWSSGYIQLEEDLRDTKLSLRETENELTEMSEAYSRAFAEKEELASRVAVLEDENNTLKTEKIASQFEFRYLIAENIKLRSRFWQKRVPPKNHPQLPEAA